MSREYQVNESKEEIDKLMVIYFNFINGKYLEKALKALLKEKVMDKRLSLLFSV